MVAVHQCFRSFFAGGIWLQWMAAISFFGCWVRRVGTIDAGGGSKYVFFDAILPAKFKHIQAAGHIGIHEDPGVLGTGSHARPGCQIDDSLEFF